MNTLKKIMLYLSSVIFIFFLLGSVCRKPCPTTVTIFVAMEGFQGTIPADFLAGKVVFICPGDNVILGWNSENAVEVKLTEVREDGTESQEIVDPQGNKTLSPTMSAGYEISATGEDCSAIPQVARIVVIEQGEEMQISLQKPPVDPDTNMPANLVWTYEASGFIYSQNLHVTAVQLDNNTATNLWPTWDLQHIDSNGFSVSSPLGSNLTNVTAFPMIGQFNAAPTNVSDPVAIIKPNVPMTIKLRVACR